MPSFRHGQALVAASISSPPHPCSPLALNSSIHVLIWLQAHPLLQVVLCTPEPIDIPGVECVTYELEDLGVDNMAHILTSIAPQVVHAPLCQLMLDAASASFTVWHCSLPGILTA